MACVQVTLRDYMGYRRQEESGQNAFQFIDCVNRFGSGCDDEFPRIDWVRGPPSPFLIS